MITVRFTVRAGQGGAGGFGLGDMAVSGNLGTADSAGHVPHQGMMTYLSVVQLLVRRDDDGLSVAGKGGGVARTEDPVASDWEAALAVFRPLVSGPKT
ncbi:hypothetical protein NX794_23910 [Streptomyces sp. LP11]|uniref:Uncharacterized protein n=1 Tax=Streptomyces pyxinicus TaxID=2970331 RepID=A0ABT2B6W3_9ACTN|nr:hypothetical protein [Streptomyces sp. LP11]MCS0604236.1 hypothetical protein [Streptomyces sp. LP11]